MVRFIDRKNTYFDALLSPYSGYFFFNNSELQQFSLVFKYHLTGQLLQIFIEILT